MHRRRSRRTGRGVDDRLGGEQVGGRARGVVEVRLREPAHVGVGSGRLQPHPDQVAHGDGQGEELHDRNEDPDNSGLPRCLEHDGSTDRSRSYLLFCPATGFGVVALANSGEGPDPVLWWHFRSGLVHAALGTQPLDATRPLLTRVAPTLLVGLPLLQLAALVAQLFAIRASRRRAGIGAAAALLLGAAAACFGYVLAPAQAAGLPLHQLWSAAPDLGVSTVLSTLLLVCSGAVALHGFHVARPASRRQRPSG